ncbi:MAG: tryptophan--tRNA ligase [candidate division KSB1 bacterium]|nr:tryptophan--tRNA ligase [candidate division KSB1 bacterium]MDZ7334265.1 tryptophan--tRNA ligase [candidate division KSB1 bacterium]MDZ7356337.1 tryptophan--tRNA ligase [candidate division KSB1 bacterium]MDZ7401029.1 tryptophan--tRNA ligase [candidate division KSB1 bacterium]
MKKRILSGMRPTGKLHLGNYVGALENWVSLQNEYENFHLVADWHLLTTNLDTSDIERNTIEMVIDWLSAGIDPEKSPIFVQSKIKEHAELHLIFSMLVTVPRLERNPTVKEQARDLGLENNMSYGHLGYPVLQAADILLYKAHLVPVGEDQLPHIELTREIARKFNATYGEVFIVPSGRVTEFSRLPGLDGRKMSKSLGNTILLSDSPEQILTKVKQAITDPLKIRRGDPGRPEICNVFTYHRKFNPAEVPEIERDCRSGALGCVDCKKNLANKLSRYLEPFREKRSYYEQHLGEIKEIIAHGNTVAQRVASETMAQVHQVMKIG